MRKFVIPSLLAAGFLSPSTAKALASQDTHLDGLDLSGFAERLKLQHTYTLAGHRSHSSHSSHSSHRSSSTGGYSKPRAAPAPLYTAPPSSSRNSQSTPPSSILPSPPAAAAPKTLPGNSEKFLEIAKRVQLALTSYGYYDGAIDGIVGRSTKAALSKFQTDYSLKVTGTITPEVLDAFGITAN